MCGSLTSIKISLTPVLINRVVLSLKKTADDINGVNQAWNATHFTTIKFGLRSMTMISGITTGTGQLREDSRETLLDTSDHNNIPLDDLTQHARAPSPASHIGV